MSRRRRRLPYSDDMLPERPLWQRISSAGWILLGLILGLVGGLFYAWLVDPVIYVNSSPARLSEEYQAEYIFLVSQSYAADADWPRAEQRLAALEDPNLTQTVNDLLDAYVRDLQSPEALRHMAELALQLGAQGGAVAIFAPTPENIPTPTLAVAALPTQPVTATPLPPTNTPPPTASPTATLLPQPSVVLAYRLLEQERVCPASGNQPQIEVITQDALLAPLPGVEVQVSWANGRDRFFTGFKPTQGAGYGDFTMESEISYTILLPAGSPEVSGLRVEPCADGSLGGWRLTFQNIELASE